MTDLPPFPWLDCFIILGLVLLNGVFAMTELAIVSAKPARLQGKAKEGSRGAKAALRLAADPGKFLSTVQIGITLISILAGAYSGASLGMPVALRLERWGMDPDIADTAGFAIVIGITTYASLVIGELVPKHIALRSAEPIAIIVAPIMEGMARVTAPLVWVLDRSTAGLLRVMGIARATDDMVTAEELHMIFAEATKSGVIEENERAIISGVVRLADRPVREVMTPRTEVDWIAHDADTADIRARLTSSPHSLLPVADGSVDNVIGVVATRDIYAALLRGEIINLSTMLRRAEIIPDQIDAMDALRILQQSEVTMALVHDEYGHFDGLVTPADLLSAIAGQFASDQDNGDSPSIIEREDGSLLVSGAMPADALADRLEIALPEDRDYATVAGHALYHLRHLPHEGETFTDQGWRFEIVDMDGRKIDKLIVSRLVPEG